MLRPNRSLRVSVLFIRRNDRFDPNRPHAAGRQQDCDDEHTYVKLRKFQGSGHQDLGGSNYSPISNVRVAQFDS